MLQPTHNFMPLFMWLYVRAPLGLGTLEASLFVLEAVYPLGCLALLGDVTWSLVRHCLHNLSLRRVSLNYNRNASFKG